MHQLIPVGTVTDIQRRQCIIYTLTVYWNAIGRMDSPMITVHDNSSSSISNIDARRLFDVLDFVYLKPDPSLTLNPCCSTELCLSMAAQLNNDCYSSAVLALLCAVLFPSARIVSRDYFCIASAD